MMQNIINHGGQPAKALHLDLGEGEEDGGKGGDPCGAAEGGDGDVGPKGNVVLYAQEGTGGTNGPTKPEDNGAHVTKKVSGSTGASAKPGENGAHVENVSS